MTTNAAPPGTTAADAGDVRSVAERAAWQRVLMTGGAWVLLLDLVLIGVFTALSPYHVFFSMQNLQNQLLNGSEGLLLALAMTMLLGAGLFDLSVGANLVLSSVIGAMVLLAVAGGEAQPLQAADVVVLQNVPVAIVAGLLASVLAGVAFGAVNGLLIAYLRVNSLIATLGTLSVGTGAAFVITNGGDIGGLPQEIQSGFGLYKLGGVLPMPAIVAVGVALLMWAMFRYTKFGLDTLAIGSSRLAAERAGLKVKRHMVQLTAAAGGLAGLAGFINLSHYAATTSLGHSSDSLAAVTAAVIGGTALNGGRVSILGTFWGNALAGILISGLVIIGVVAFYQLIAIGTVLIVAVAIDQYRNRSRETW
jgi:ribose transport system permease protein